MEELRIPTAWLDPRLREARNTLATIMRGGGAAGLPIALRLAVSNAFSEIQSRSGLPYPPAGETELTVADEAAVRDALGTVRNLLLELVADSPPEQGFGFAYAARSLAEALNP